MFALTVILGNVALGFAHAPLWTIAFGAVALTICAILDNQRLLNAADSAPISTVVTGSLLSVAPTSFVFALVSFASGWMVSALL